MEKRLDMLGDHEAELARMISADNEAFIDIKHSLEDDIRVLTDQLHFMTSLHQLNEVRVYYGTYCTLYWRGNVPINYRSGWITKSMF